MLIDDLSTFVFALVGAIGSVATAGALVFLWYQSRQTQKQIQLTQEQTNYTREEMDSTLRPWIGISDVQIQANEFVTFDVKNHGRIPARLVRRRSVFDKTKISKDQLRSTKAEDSDILLFPDATQKMSSILPEEPEYQYVAIMIEYEYANNKHGEYGLIAKRIAETGIFIYLEIFAR